MPQNQCYVWGTPIHEVRPFDGAFFTVDSLRAGGRYAISEMAVDILTHATIDQKLLLTTWLCGQRQGGIPEPKITREVLDEIKSKKPMVTSERIRRALLFLNRRVRVGHGISISNEGFDLSTDDDCRLAALTECRDKRELLALLELLQEMNLIKEIKSTMSEAQFTPTSEGWFKIEDLSSQAILSSQVFVAMWFNELTEEPYRNGLYKAIYDAGYDPMRIDQQHHHLNKVDDEIIAEIRRSKFLVADFTCAPQQVRGGVYFEAGFAMGLDIPIILTCKDTSLNDLHFDTRQYPHISWRDSADLYGQLRARIGALIGDGPKRRR